MADEVKTKTKKKEVVYYTQKELAQRWRVTPATIKELRDKGQVPCFFPPGSSRVLYPVNEIIQIEEDKSNHNQKENYSRKCKPETMMKKPVNPAKSQQDWRM